jgi:AcrR family transcriptional regulator
MVKKNVNMKHFFLKKKFMVQLIHSGENIDKIKDILDAAQKRFGMFGLEKTTMNEIAGDLNMSKGSIYYYFPDKEQLYKAVVEKEHNEFLEEVKEKIQKLNDPAEMLKEYVKVNLQFFKTFLNLSRTRLNELAGLNPFMKEIITELRSKEIALLTGIFKNGKDDGQFNIKQPEEIARLFMDLIRGLRKSAIGKKEIFHLEKEEYDILSKKINQFSQIFINGLRFHEKDK